MVVPESSINNIMGGLESTGGVRLNNHKRKLKQRFDIVKKLGQGTYGKVQLGINKETGQEVAIKTIKKCKIETEADLTRIRREIQIMSSVQHPNIIHIYEVFENREKIVLVMEYAAGGELYDFLSERKVLAEEEARRIFRQISTAVYYCHKHKICHRDLKLENILLDENGSAKIADFGLSNVFDQSRLLGTFCGSPLYASPEIVKGTPYHGPEVDCWSLGVLLYTLVYGAMPFDGSNFKRLVRQISQGDYFEPKKPSPASALIRDMLNINPSRRADINAICSHWWIDSGQSEACLEVAEDLANQTPVRLDLLLCLAPSGNGDQLLVADQPPTPEGGDRPLRSQSLSSLATVQQDFSPDSANTKRDVENRAKRKEDGSVKKRERSRSRRERSSSRSRKDDSTPEPESSAEKPKRKSLKTKKTSNEKLVIEEPKEELLPPKIAEVDEDMAKSTETIQAPRTPVEEVPQSKSPVPSDKVVIEEMKLEDTADPTTPVAETPKQLSPAASVPTTPTSQSLPPVVSEKCEEKQPDEEKPTKPMERRKSKIFETAEKFNKINTADTQPKPQPKKMILPGVKVSDAKKAYERRSSLASSTSLIRGSSSRRSLSGESNASSPPADDAKFSLASSVALNKLVEDVERLSKLEDEKEMEKQKNVEKSVVNKDTEKPIKPSPEKIVEVTREGVKKDEIKNEGAIKTDDDARKKVRNAVQVIGNAITEGDTKSNKAATLPRRRTSRAEIKLAMPASSKPPDFRSEVEHMVGTPVSVQRSEVKFPVAAPPVAVPRSTSRQGSAPREFIVPIQFEQDPSVKPPPPPSSSQRSVSRTSSKRMICPSLSRQSTLDSDLGSTASIGEPIRKSAREVIIPIAVEGGGFVTPSADAISRMSSLNESEDDLPRGFGLHSTRRHNRQLESTDSVSSDEDDDNFEILTAENLFSTLLSRVRSLTQRLNTEDRQTTFPRLFNHHSSIFDFPPRRLAEARSFGRADSVPWRRSMSRESSTLPRDGSISRIGVPKRTGSLKSSGKDKPPFYRPTLTRSSVDSFCPYPSPSPASNWESNNNTPDHSNAGSAVPQPQPQETCSQQQLTIVEESDKSQQENTRGIPTVEIVGSSLKKPLKSTSKTETSKKVSKLPQPLIKTVKEPKVDQAINKEEQNTGTNNSIDNKSISESIIPHTQPRRNSLERPSYYNALCKNSLQALTSGMTRSLNLSADHSLNGNISSDSSASAINEDSNRFNKYSPSRFDSRESSVTEKDYLRMRPYSSLSRTFSLKNPSVRYTVLRKSPQKSIAVGELEARFRSSSPVATIVRSSSARNDERFSSRFLRPKSFYEGSDLSKYQSTSSAHASPVTDVGKLTSDLYINKTSPVGRRSPSYQRSISLFDGSKCSETGRLSRITPDRSVLKKFLPDRKVVSEEEKVLSESEVNEKAKVRKVSRFLRPDFYDTPKEDSVYEKKEKTKNTPNGDIWEEKGKTIKSCHKKSKSSQDSPKNETTRLSIIDKAIRSLKEHSSSKTDRESMERESNLIKRAVSLENCSIFPESRHRRSTSVTPQSSYGNKISTSKHKEPFQKKKHEDFRKIVDQNLNTKGKELASSRVQKEDSVIKKLVRKLSPKGAVKKNVSKYEDKQICNGSINVLENNHDAMEESGSSVQDNHSRLNRIAGLKRLEFGRQVQSADSTPSMEESKMSTELDDSSSFLSPTEDGSDTWSISSDYADAREFNFSSTNPEDSVSDRIRRKSFYSRFNQSKRKKSSQSSQIGGARSRLPNYSRSMSSGFNNEHQSKPI